MLKMIIQIQTSNWGQILFILNQETRQVYHLISKKFKLDKKQCQIIQ